jgi:hypothetical protein
MAESVAGQVVAPFAALQAIFYLPVPGQKKT